MPGGMGNNSNSKKSYKGTCEEVDVKQFGSKDAKKHSKHIHHKAIRKRGKKIIENWEDDCSQNSEE